ncbi:MAG: hypothetical protein M3O50_22130 [Myxococcota bacterium]|nr:hypothetical protein [Myxococcota bacterium]
MKSIAKGSLVLVLGLAACGGANKNADEPENTEESPPAKPAASLDPTDPVAVPDESAVLGSGAGREHPVAEHATIRDEGEKKAVPCSGASIPDLLAALSQAACEVPNAKAGDRQQDVKKNLDIKVMADPPRIPPGSSASFTVLFKNKGKTDLPLDFTVDPEPRFDFEVYTAKGTRVDRPGGSEPHLPAEVASAPVPIPRTARVTLAPLGTAKLVLSWTAVRYKWASKDRAKGALPGHGYPRDPAGPLPKGKYLVRVVTPLTGVTEGVDHEVSHPRVDVEVGNL